MISTAENLFEAGPSCWQRWHVDAGVAKLGAGFGSTFLMGSAIRVSQTHRMGARDDEITRTPVRCWTP